MVPVPCLHDNIAVLSVRLSTLVAVPSPVSIGFQIGPYLLYPGAYLRYHGIHVFLEIVSEIPGIQPRLVHVLTNRHFNHIRSIAL